MKKIYVLLFFFSLKVVVYGQGNFQGQEFIINPFGLSPSNTGLNGDHEMFAGFSSRYTGVNGAPVNVWADYNGIVKSNSGLGVMIDYERFGAFRNVRANLSYAYHLLLAKKHRLSLGLSFSLNQTQLDFTNSNSDPGSDPILLNADVKSGIAFNAGVGVTYSYKGFTASVAMPFMINNKRTDVYTLYSQPQSLRYAAAYDIVINTNWDIKPAAVINQQFQAPVNYTAVISTRFKQLVWLNLSYSAQSMLGAGVGAVITGRVTFQYTFQYSTEGIVRASTGNHELVLGVLLGKVKEASNNSVFKTSRQNPYYEWQ